MSEWQDKQSVKKGNLAESIVDRYIIDAGYVPYRPFAEGAHPFDRLCASPDKQTIFIADCKGKPARVYYPDTGIDISHYHDYLNVELAHNMQVFLFFVDEVQKRIYGGFLSILREPYTLKWKGRTLEYPLEHGGIVYFPLDRMEEIHALTEAECAELAAYSNRKKDYDEAYRGAEIELRLDIA